MKVRAKLICDVEIEPDADGGTVGAREVVAARIEEAIGAAGRVRFVEILPTARRLVQARAGDVRYVGECEYIPCDRKGKCLDGAACAGCAYADVLGRMALYEDVLVARG